MKDDEIRKAFEEMFEVPEFIDFDGEDFMYYGEDPILDEQCQSIQDQYRGFKSGLEESIKEISELKEKLKIAEEWLTECSISICRLCRVVNPQHEDCTQCDDRDSLLEALSKIKE